MSRASDVAAQLATLLPGWLGKVWASHLGRWILVVPVASAACWTIQWVATASALFFAVWTWFDDQWWTGDIGAFAADYTFVVVGALVAPSRRPATAFVLAAIKLIPITSMAAHYSGTVWNPWLYVLATALSVGIAVSLVLGRCSAWRLLLVPAYWFGATLFLIPSLPFCLIGMMIDTRGPGSCAGFNMGAAAAAAGSILLPAWMAPRGAKFVAIGCFMADLAFGIESVWQWMLHGNLNYFNLPGLAGGGVIALVLVLFFLSRVRVLASSAAWWIVRPRPSYH